MNTPPDQLFELPNKEPYIVAMGETEKDIAKYYIIVDRQLICVRGSPVFLFHF